METTTQAKAKKPKTKQKQKPGKVVRINPTTLKLVSSEMKNEETIVSVIERLIKAGTKKGKTYFILPETQIVCDSLADAKGKAIVAAVLKHKLTDIETPIAVREVF